MKKIKIKVIVILSLLIAITGSALYILRNNNQEVVVDDTTIVEEPEVGFSDQELALFDTWKEHKKINEDYRCEIVFDSGIINLPVVQGETNEQYERVNWETMEHDEEGSIFMDYECSINSSNITMYGHYVYPSIDPDQTHKFSPLTLLLEETNYEKNSTLKLVFENEIRTYQVAYVFYCPLNLSDEGYYYVDDDAQYYIPEYSEEYFAKYKSYVEARSQYDTGLDLNYGDKTLTLQTCVKNRDDLREIVVCKEISRRSH